VTLYRLADVMVVTPVRDGMNLVAKEFVAARTDRDGVLVLSELAGAASELAEALPVNPYDIEATATTLHRALVMPMDERRARMDGLRRRVMTYDVHGWAQDFLTTLARTRATPPSLQRPSPADVVGASLERARRAPALALLLDYDGTLVPFAATPELAAPPRNVLELLARLAARPATATHVVSGRGREVLQRWLGHLAVGLHAEHGLWSRDPGATEWSQLETPIAAWKPRVGRILDQFAARTPGSLVEEKEHSLAWHHRAADAQFGQHQANELRLHLTEVLSNVPVEILTGSKVIEVRPHGAHKGRVVRRVVEELRPDPLIVAMGDDRTDEDMFAALPEGALAIHVGPGPSSARIHLAGPSDACAWLDRLCDA
jgi:trehalose 6-phosphate synthase/phosphatase